jgi:hypothetical protein
MPSAMIPDVIGASVRSHRSGDRETAQSAWVLVQQSTVPNVDFSCAPTCRWGDYAGATPDPVASAGGRVWLSGEWNVPMTDGSAPVWRTWNWVASP